MILHLKMFYHCLISWSDSFWMTYHDFTKELAIQSVAVPFLSRQIKLVQVSGITQLFNYSTCSRLVFYKTEKRLTDVEIKKLRNADHIGVVCTREILSSLRTDLSTLESKSLISLATSTPKKQIFVIMAFGDKQLDSAYELAIKPLETTFGYKVFRIDNIHDSSMITDQILTSIAESKIIISDLTLERPNCYYETGIAQSLGKEIILTIRKGERKHFDLAGYRFIEWETAADLKRQLEERMTSLLTQLEKGASSSGLRI